MGTSKVHTVLHLSSTSGPGGAETVVSHLSEAINGDGFRSVVCLFRDGWLKDRCERNGIDTHVLALRSALDWRWGREISHLIRAGGVSLIHSHEFTANTYGMMISRWSGIPLIATVHGKNYFWEKPKRRFAYRLVSRNAVMVAVSRDLKNFIVDRTGILPDRIRVVYNGIDTTFSVDGQRVQRCRSELGIAGNESVVGAVGSLYPVKGHTYLLQAAKQVLRACPLTVFLIVGQGELEMPLKEEAQRLGLGRRVRFLGFREDVPELLALLNVFVLPSLSEGLSIALLEAMASAKAVVATSVGGNPELVAHGESGVLVPPRDPEALASEIIRLLVDRDHNRKVGNNARKRVTEEFSLASMISQYQHLYRECLNERHESKPLH